MSLDDRLLFLLIGCAIGFVIGYITRMIRDIKQELEDVDKIVIKDNKRKRSDFGFMRYPIVSDLTMIFVLALTVWAAFASQKASNEVKDTQEKLDLVVACNQDILADVLGALNERTSSNQAQNSANLTLQRSQATMFNVLLHKPSYSDEKKESAVANYVNSLSDFIAAASTAADKANRNPYPEKTDLSECVNRGGK